MIVKMTKIWNYNLRSRKFTPSYSIKVLHQWH